MIFALVPQERNLDEDGRRPLKKVGEIGRAI